MSTDNGVTWSGSKGLPFLFLGRFFPHGFVHYYPALPLKLLFFLPKSQKMEGNLLRLLLVREPKPNNPITVINGHGKDFRTRHLNGSRHNQCLHVAITILDANHMKTNNELEKRVIYSANVPDEVSLLASGVAPAQAGGMTEVPKGQGLAQSVCSTNIVHHLVDKKTGAILSSYGDLSHARSAAIEMIKQGNPRPTISSRAQTITEDRHATGHPSSQSRL